MTIAPYASAKPQLGRGRMATASRSANLGASFPRLFSGSPRWSPCRWQLQLFEARRRPRRWSITQEPSCDRRFRPRARRDRSGCRTAHCGLRSVQEGHMHESLRRCYPRCAQLVGLLSHQVVTKVANVCVDSIPDGRKIIAGDTPSFRGSHGRSSLFVGTTSRSYKVLWSPKAAACTDSPNASPADQENSMQPTSAHRFSGNACSALGQPRLTLLLSLVLLLAATVMLVAQEAHGKSERHLAAQGTSGPSGGVALAAPPEQTIESAASGSSGQAAQALPAAQAIESEALGSTSQAAQALPSAQTIESATSGSPGQPAQVAPAEHTVESAASGSHGQAAQVAPPEQAIESEASGASGQAAQTAPPEQTTSKASGSSGHAAQTAPPQPPALRRQHR